MLLKCKLCHDQAELRRSHVIPELCYRATYDEKHRTTKFEADPDGKQLIQKGIRDRLLCDQCECLLCKTEDKFKKYWYGTPALQNSISSQHVQVSGFDYKVFKLFHLSIIWRASVSNLPEFNTVQLGPHDETLRQMLLTGNPGSEDHYPVFARVLLRDTGEVAFGVVGKPQQSEYNAHSAYYAVYAGCEWAFIMANRACPELLSVVPRTNGTMFLGTVPLDQSNTVRIFTQ